MRYWRPVVCAWFLILAGGHGTLWAQPSTKQQQQQQKQLKQPEQLKQQRPDLRQSAPIRVEAAGLTVISEQPQRLGQSTQVKVTIKNAGATYVSQVPWVLRNMTDGTQVGQGTFSSIQAGQSAEQTVEFQTAHAGTMKLRLQVERKDNSATATAREVDVVMVPAPPPAKAQGDPVAQAAARPMQAAGATKELLVPVRLELSRSETGGGLALAVTIVLRDPAPAGGILTTLSSPDAGMSFPLHVMVAAGKTRQDFSLQVPTVTAPKTVSITVAALGTTNTKSLLVTTRGAPTITAFTPTSAPYGVQTEITVTGTNLDSVTAVNLTEQVTLLATTPTSVRLRTSADGGSSKIVLWYRSANDGTTGVVYSTGIFEVILPLPVISSITQPNPGGLVIEGDYLYFATRVQIGTQDGQIFRRVPASFSRVAGAKDQLTIIPPSGMIVGQPYDIKVTNTGGTTTSPGAWTLQPPPAAPLNPPTITSFTPTSAPYGVQTEVTVTGTNLDSVWAVNLTEQVTLLAKTPTSVRLRSSADGGSSKIVLSYRSANGTTGVVYSTGIFEVILPLPVISSITQPNPGGLVIEGDYLYFATRVQIGTQDGQIFGRVPASFSRVAGAKDQLTIIPPSGMIVGQPYDIKVTNTGGTTTSPGAWTPR